VADAPAATATASFSVSVTVVTGCVIVPSRLAAIASNTVASVNPCVQPGAGAPIAPAGPVVTLTRDTAPLATLTVEF
jgi:hypothetical protein